MPGWTVSKYIMYCISLELIKGSWPWRMNKLTLQRIGLGLHRSKTNVRLKMLIWTTTASTPLNFFEVAQLNLYQANSADGLPFWLTYQQVPLFFSTVKETLNNQTYVHSMYVYQSLTQSVACQQNRAVWLTPFFTSGLGCRTDALWAMTFLQ